VPVLAPDRARAVIRGMAGRRILVVGDLMLDHFIWGDVERISPEAPVPVVRVTRESFHPGGCGNVAANVRALGGRPAIVAPVGEDRAGASVREALAAQGIDASGLVPIPGRVTTKKTRIVAHHQQVVRFDREEESDLGDAGAVFLARAIAALAGADALIVSDYDKGAIGPGLLAGLLPAARRAGLPAGVDPKLRNFSRYRPVTLVTPNLKEAAHGAGFPIRTDDDLLRAGAKIREVLEADGVLVTRGDKGMSLFEAGGAVTHIPAAAREVFDVTGAGDTVVSVVALALAAGADMVTACHLANHAAGLVIREVGTATTTPERLLADLEGHEP
jgi:D-beta-D-heptose 7-phosphate kinase/D-beta-D-heptose 1-phosphate adenosyltransferase